MKINNMKLIEIAKQILNEATPKNPLNLYRSIFKVAGINFAEAEAALLLGLRKIDPTIVSVNKATPKQLERAFKSPSFRKYSQALARNYIANNNKLIDDILKKYPVDTIKGSKEARKEIANTLKIDLGTTDNIFAIKVPKKPKSKPSTLTQTTTTPTSSQTTPLLVIPPEEISITKQFIQGMKLSVLDYVKRIPMIRKKIVKIYNKNLESLDVLTNRFDDIMKRISPKIGKGGNYEIGDELKELNDVLSQFSAQKSKQQSLVWTEWKNSLSKDLQDKLPKIEDPKFQEFYKYFENSVSSATKREPPTLIYSKMNAAKKMFTPGNKGLWGNLNQFRKRLGNTLLYMDPRTWEELGQTINQYGKVRGVGKEVGDKLMATTVFWPGFMAVGQTILDYIEGTSKIDIWGGDAKYYNENKPIFDNLYLDNALNVFRVLFINYIDKLKITKEEFTSLLGWSPSLYALGLQFLGGDENKKMTKVEFESNLNKAKQEVSNVLPQLNDTLSKNPDLNERLKKIVPNIDEIIKPNETTTQPKPKFDPNF